MTCIKITLIATTLLAAPLLAAAQGKGTECTTAADWGILKSMMATTDKAAEQKLALTLSKPCLTCIGGQGPNTYAFGACFPTASKGKCTPGDIALSKANPVTATEDDPPKGLTVTCLGCAMNGVALPSDLCEGIPGGKPVSPTCGKKDSRGNKLPFDAACIKCKQAARDTGVATCAAAPAPSPPPASKTQQTPICPGSGPQTTKMMCAAVMPQCPAGQCAMRQNGGCTFKCQATKPCTPNDAIAIGAALSCYGDVACEHMAAAKLSTRCIACVTISSHPAAISKCVDLAAVVKDGQIKPTCPVELKACTGTCKAELDAMMLTLYSQPTERIYAKSKHPGIKKIGRCMEGHRWCQKDCPSAVTCAMECGWPDIDYPEQRGNPSQAQCSCWLRPACSTICDAAFKAKLIGEIRKEGCGKYEKNAVASKLKLAVHILVVEKDRPAFVAAFSKDVAAALKVAEGRIGVSGIKAGSVVVDYTIAPDISGQPIAVASITNAFQAANVQIANTKTTAAVTAADVSPPKKTAMPTYVLGSAITAINGSSGSANTVVAPTPADASTIVVAPAPAAVGSGAMAAVAGLPVALVAAVIVAATVAL